MKKQQNCHEQIIYDSPETRMPVINFYFFLPITSPFLLFFLQSYTFFFQIFLTSAMQLSIVSFANMSLATSNCKERKTCKTRHNEMMHEENV